jgi:hypothetical protein
MITAPIEVPDVDHGRSVAAGSHVGEFRAVLKNIDATLPGQLAKVLQSIPARSRCAELSEHLEACSARELSRAG